MDMASEKRESEINNKASNTNSNNNNTDNSQEIVDSSSTLASDGTNSANKEAEERQARDLKAGLHPLKVSLSPYFLFRYLFVFVLNLDR